MIADVITPEIFAPNASPKTKESGFSLLTILCDFRCSRDTAHSCNTYHRIIITSLYKVHYISAQNATNTRQQQSRNT